MSPDSLGNVAVIGFYITTVLVVVGPIAAIAFAVAWVKVTRIRHAAKDKTPAQMSSSA
jgi:hypothetical protein